MDIHKKKFLHRFALKWVPSSTLYMVHEIRMYGDIKYSYGRE